MNKLKKIIIAFLFMMGIVFSGFSQYLPKDSCKLNYNQIMFEWPFAKGVNHYKIQIAITSNKSDTSFQNIIYEKKSICPAVLIDNLPFGAKLKWRVVTYLKNKTSEISPTHSFEILNHYFNDSTKFKIEQHYKSNYSSNGVYWCDQLHVAINKNGKLVWFMPETREEFKDSRQIRDIRVLADGSITFISEPDAFHTTKEMNIIYKLPNNGVVNGSNRNEMYHHCFQKLDNGNYLVMGNQYLELERVDSKDTANRKVEMCTLIEYNEKGDTVWTWKMMDYFPLDLLAGNNGTIINPHANGFNLSNDKKYIYVSFRDISRVIKVNRVSKKIEASYGIKLNHLDTTVYETNLFMYPHNAEMLNENSMRILNNNDTKNGKISSVELFTLPKNNSGSYKSIWSFKFNFDSITNGRSLKMGNVLLLPNNNYLVNEGSANRVFEVSKNKEVLWDMMFFKKDISGIYSNAPIYKINYSPSLYPNYFTYAINEKNELLVYNLGNYTDSYLINIKDTQKQLYKLKPIKISAQGYVKVNLPKNVKELEIQSLNTNTKKNMQ